MQRGRYPQSCALARAAEIVGERWTLLIVRELLTGPKRFSDLQAGLAPITTSVLTDRLGALLDASVIARGYLPPPSASRVYTLAEHGRALEPVILSLIRWGARFLLPLHDGDQIEPAWLELALRACARTSATPSLRYRVTITGGRLDVTLDLAGGETGTRVTRPTGAASAVDASFTASGEVVLGLMAGILDPERAIRAKQIALTSGEVAPLARLTELFEVEGMEIPGVEAS